MNDITAAIMGISIAGGLYYFWFKCRIFAVDKFSFFMGILIWPVGAIIGIYWAINDFFVLRNENHSEDTKDHIEIHKHRTNETLLDENNLFLRALDEYESDKKDRALYARLFAENDGNEDIVKAKYIKRRVEDLSK